MGKLVIKGKHVSLDILNEVKRVQNLEETLNSKIDSSEESHKTLHEKHSDLQSKFEDVSKNHQDQLNEIVDNHKVLDLEFEKHKAHFYDKTNNLENKHSKLIEDIDCFVLDNDERHEEVNTQLGQIRIDSEASDTWTTIHTRKHLNYIKMLAIFSFLQTAAIVFLTYKLKH